MISSNSHSIHPPNNIISINSHIYLSKRIIQFEGSYCIDTIWLNYHPSINHSDPIKITSHFYLFRSIWSSYLLDSILFCLILQSHPDTISPRSHSNSFIHQSDIFSLVILSFSKRIIQSNGLCIIVIIYPSTVIITLRRLMIRLYDYYLWIDY